MSELSVGQLKGLTVNSNTITIPAGHKLYAPGSVVQVATIRSDTRTTYSASNSGNGTAITELALTITPKFSNSLLVCQWMINAESHWDMVLVIQRDGSLVTTAGQTGYNSVSGNIRSSGIASGYYDNDNDSTAANWFIQYFATANSTSSTTITPATRGSGATNYTLALNRTLNGSASDNQESMVSTGMIWEIAQ